jgi:hypothetical protein
MACYQWMTIYVLHVIVPHMTSWLVIVNPDVELLQERILVAANVMVAKTWKKMLLVSALNVVLSVPLNRQALKFGVKILWFFS